MQHEQFSRLLRLAHKTGDRLIVTDPNGSEPVVILPLDEYEALIEAAMGPSDMYEVPVDDAVDEAEFDPDELERGALKGLWDEPGDDAMPALEVIEQPALEDASEAPEPVRVEPVVAAPGAERPPVVRPQLNRGPRRREAEGGEEQFYLEPI